MNEPPEQVGNDGLLEPPDPAPWWAVPLMALLIVVVFGGLAALVVWAG